VCQLSFISFISFISFSRVRHRLVRLRALTIAALLISIIGTPISAQDSLHQDVPTSILERVANSYGGKRLAKMKSVSIESDRRLAWPGQGQTAAYVEFATDLNHKHFDLKRKTGSVERWIHQSGNVYHNRYVVSEDGGATIDYFQNSVTRNPETTYMQSFGPDYRMSDVLLAYLLATNPPDARYIGQRRYGEHIHDVIRFSVTEGSPEIDVYISTNDGLIRRVFFSRDIGDVNILFSNHRRAKGITFASEIQLFLDDTLVEYESGLKLSPNTRVSRKIAIEPGLTPPQDGPDMDEMTVDEIRPGLFLVGQGDYSLFIEQYGELIAVNAYGGLKERYEALNVHLSKTLPLKSLIVTHHHSDHMDGVGDAIELGAAFHVTDETRHVLSESHPEIGEQRIESLVDGQNVGSFEISILGTSHSAENALVFHTPSGVLFQDDHYHGLMKEGPSRIQPSARILHDYLIRSHWDVKYLVSGHTRKAEEWSVFDNAVKNASSSTCTNNRIICRGRHISGSIK